MLPNHVGSSDGTAYCCYCDRDSKTFQSSSHSRKAGRASLEMTLLQLHTVVLSDVCIHILLIAGSSKVSL